MCVFITAGPITKLFAGGRRRVEECRVFIFKVTGPSPFLHRACAARPEGGYPDPVTVCDFSHCVVLHSSKSSLLPTTVGKSSADFFARSGQAICVDSASGNSESRRCVCLLLQYLLQEEGTQGTSRNLLWVCFIPRTSMRLCVLLCSAKLTAMGNNTLTIRTFLFFPPS